MSSSLYTNYNLSRRFDPMGSITYLDRVALRKACEMGPAAFAEMIGATETKIDFANLPAKQRPYPGNDRYWFKDNGARVLAVAHLDTVCEDRSASIMDTADGPVVFSGALDDRLGAYVITDMLPKMGITCDILLTVGEEDGESTAEHFDPEDHHDRTYDWIIQFDRGVVGRGLDTVLYQYEDDELVDRVEATGIPVGHGAFSDISYLEHLGVKAMNWGVGYRDYHGPRGHAWLHDTCTLVDAYVEFHQTWEGTAMPHYIFPEAELDERALFDEDGNQIAAAFLRSLDPEDSEY